MISMDEQKAQQVWSRVMNVSAPCPAKDGTEGAQLSAETVAALTQAEWQDAATYRTLAARAGERRCTFEALAVDEGRHAQLLYCLLQQTL